MSSDTVVTSFESAFERAQEVILEFFAGTIEQLPLLVLALLILVIGMLITFYFYRGLKLRLKRRLKSTMLADMICKILWAPALILNFFIAFKIAGFSGLAFSFLGGTGVLGLILGFAFKDIGENFLASLLIGLQRPFRSGDIVTIGDVTGVVDRVTSRGTILMAFDGNHVQIPNTTVYKSVIYNLTANPKIRFDFEVGVGFDVDLSHAIEVARTVITSQKEVLVDPEPLFLIEKFGAATISLRIYFWIDGHRLSGLKVKSLLMRRIKEAFEDEDISMPDEAREIVFPQGVPIVQQKDAPGKKAVNRSPSASHPPQEEDVSSDADDIKRQIAESDSIEIGEALV